MQSQKPRLTSRPVLEKCLLGYTCPAKRGWSAVPSSGIRQGALRELRTRRGLSQEELSLTTGVHRNYIGGVERAERSPSVSTMTKLAEGVGVRWP